MATAMARQKHHLHTIQYPGDIFIRRIAEWRFKPYPLYLFQAFHIIQTAASDYTDSCYTHAVISFRVHLNTQVLYQS
jgi:hypothetical protein